MFRTRRIAVLSICFLLFTPLLCGQSRPPVILVEAGGGAVGFGLLESLLNAQGIRTEHFRAYSVPPKHGTQNATLEELGEALGAVIARVADPQVDLIAFSMGGPVVRCYLSGKQLAPGVFKPPAEHKVRKVVFLATGFFGGPVFDPNSDISVRALEYGSRLQWDVATWNQHHDDLRQVDAVALVGDGASGSDGIIMTTSGSLLFAYPQERTRVITGCHVPSLCAPGVAYVSSDQHPAWLLINSFLSGTDDWKRVGHSPQDDALLSHVGGVMVAVKDARDNPVQDVQLRMSDKAMMNGVAPDCVGTFVEDSIEKGEYTLHAIAPFPVPDRTFTALPGTFTVLTMKPGPLITAVVPADSGVKSSTIPANAIISISGERLGNGEIAANPPFPTTLGSTSVTVNDQPIPLMYVSESRIKAQLPDNASGFARLVVTNGDGNHAISFFIGPSAPNKSSVSLALSDGGADSTSTVGPSGDLKVGYSTVEVSSGTVPYGTAVFSLVQNDAVVSEVGVPASTATTTARIFVDFRSTAPAIPGQPGAGNVMIDTGLAVVNPGRTAANLTYRLRGTDGETLAMGRGTLDAAAHFAKFVDQLGQVAPDFVLPASFSESTGFGSLEIKSDQPVSILALRLTVNQRGETILTSTPIADLSKPLATGPIYFPHFADGGGYVSTILLLNTSTEPETGKFTLLDDDGMPLVVNQVGGTNDSTFAYSIAAGGSFVFQTDGTPLRLKAGSIRLMPDAGTSTPVGSGIFRYTLDGVVITESGVPASTPTTHARIYVDKSAGHDTGLAIIPGGAGAEIALRAFEKDGLTAAGDGAGSIPLEANNHKAAFVGQLISGLPDGFTGVLDISSKSSFVALTLRSLTNERGHFLMTSFPIADVNQPGPTPIIFPQIAAGGGYNTQVILLSATGAANATVKFFGSTGLPINIGK